MCLYARRINLFEEIDRHTKIYVADAVDGKSDRIFAGIKHAVLAGAVILEFEKVVAVVECEYVLCLTCVNEFHNDCLLIDV